MLQEAEDLVAGRTRGLALGIHQVRGQHAMGNAHHLAEERRRGGIRRAVGKSASIEAFAERTPVGREPRRRAMRVALEPVGQHREVIALQPRACHLATGAAWETVVDALHMQTHAALLADSVLPTIGRGLRCTAAEALGQSADVQTARLVARYQIQFLTRPGDLTRAIN